MEMTTKKEMKDISGNSWRFNSILYFEIEFRNAVLSRGTWSLLTCVEKVLKMILQTYERQLCTCTSHEISLKYFVCKLFEVSMKTSGMFEGVRNVRRFLWNLRNLCAQRLVLRAGYKYPLLPLQCFSLRPVSRPLLFWASKNPSFHSPLPSSEI